MAKDKPLQVEDTGFAIKFSDSDISRSNAMPATFKYREEAERMRAFYWGSQGVVVPVKVVITELPADPE